MSDAKLSELVKASIESRIIEAFREAPEAIDELVRACLNKEVDSYGNQPKYGRDKMPYLTYLAQQAIQDVARSAVLEYISEIEPQIKEQVRSSLSTADITDAFTKSILDATKHDFQIKVEFATGGS